MEHKLRIQSVLVFLMLVGLLFGALTLLPALAQAPRSGTQTGAQQGHAAPDEPIPPDGGMQALPSNTGYIIDDGDPGFSPPPPYPTGNWLYFTGGGYKGDCIYTDVTVGPSGDVATWRPDLAPGVYDVQVHWWANSPTQRSDARYTVYYDGGSVVRLVDQRRDAAGNLVAGANSGWLSLGRFPFAGGTLGYVTLSDITSTLGTGTYVVADGARFLPLEVWVDDNYTPTGPNDGHLWGVTAFDNIREGIAAVANNGTVHVGPGDYYQNITVTKSITLSGAGAATTVISVTSGAASAAIEVLANDVTISGFTVEGVGAGYGMVNYNFAAPPWAYNLTGYRISNNVVRGFQYGILFYTAQGQISNNRVYNNSEMGIWVFDSPSGAGGGPTTISDNALWANGGGAGGNDYDIRVEDSYTGTMVTGNVITGSLGANEVGIYVRNKAGDLTLLANRVNGCTTGVSMTNSVPTIQKVSLQGNTITGGTTGVHAHVVTGSSSLWQLTIGGSVANANNIYGNTGDELRLTGYGVPVTATYNYWGVCTLREIEDEIWHRYDASGEGLVTYEPALCVPRYIDVEAWPTTLPAEGVSTATITATVRDIAGNRARPGTMVGITTSLGSVPYGYVEENNPAVTQSGAWTPFAFARASGGAYVQSANPADSISWSFTGPAVSLVYVKYGTGGSADVYVDDLTTPITTVNMSSLLPLTTAEWLVEAVIATGLNPAGVHTITVRPTGSGPIWVDAFRSGGVVGTQGRIVTTLTSGALPPAMISRTATIWGTVYNGRIITNTSTALYPIITGTATVDFQAADVGIVSKTASLATLTPGQEVTYTITYRNYGPASATGVLVTDTLPTNFVKVRSSSSPNREPPSAAPGNQYVWSIGNLLPGATGVITLVARPDPAVPWPAPTVVTNVAEIGSRVSDNAAGNNKKSASVTVVPSLAAAITVTAYPTVIPADGASTSSITATVVDAYNNPVIDGTLVTFTANLNTVFLPGATSTKVVSTTAGVATTTLQAGTVAGLATVTARAGTVQASTQVRLLALEPYTVAISAHPPAIRVSNGEITTTLRITVTDRYSNLVNGATVNLTTTAGTFPASGGTTLVVTTSNGIALTGLASGPSVTTATVTAAITTTGRPTATVQVYFRPDVPFTIASVAYPTLIRVCGDTAVVTATITDRFGNMVEDGTEVTFNVVQGDRGDMVPRLVSTVNGVAVSTVRTKGYKFGERFLDVYILAGREAQPPVWYQRISLEEGPPYNISLVPSPQVIAVGGRESEIRALVQDCGGNNVRDGTVVTFEVSSLGTITPTVTTTLNGRAYATFRSGCTIGTAVITATSDSRAFNTTVVLEPGPADLISVGAPSPSSIRNCGGKAVIVATVYDVCGNLVKDNTPVLFTPQYNYVSASPTLAYTRRGVVSTTVTALNKPLDPWPAALEQIDVTSGSAFPGFTSLTILPGHAANVGVTADPGSIPINGDVNGYDIIVVARVADCSNTPVEDGTAVTLQTDLGIFRESGMRNIVRTTASGLVTATLTSQSVAGVATVTASANSAVGRVRVRFLPGEPWLIEVLGLPTNIPADGRSRSLLTARVKDEYNNPVLDGITVTFVTDYGYFAESGQVHYTTTTNIDGFAFARLVADTVPHTALVRVIAYNDRQGYTYVFFVSGHYIYLPMLRRNFMP